MVLAGLPGCNCGDDVGASDAGRDGGSTSVDSGSVLIDAGPLSADAGMADAGVRNVLYAHLKGTLVKVDLSNGQLTTVDPTGQTWLALAWDDSAKLARVVTGNFSP